MYILFSLGWDPVHLEQWNDHEGSTYVINHDVPILGIVKDLVSAYTRISTQRADAHYQGTGLKHGIEFDPTLALSRHFKKYKNVAMATALDMILTGAYWPGDRLSSINNSVTPQLCTRCNLAPDSAYHTLWECPCNADIDSPYVQDTQKYMDLADRDKEHPCLWSRGILTSDLCTIPQEHLPPATSNTTIKTFVSHVQSWGSGVYYGDGSGGSTINILNLEGVGVQFVL